MPAIPSKQEQKEVNDLLNQALELMKQINGAVDNNADTFKKFKGGVADASATATAYLKKVTDAGKYTGEGLGKGVIGFEKTSKFRHGSVFKSWYVYQVTTLKYSLSNRRY